MHLLIYSTVYVSMYLIVFTCTSLILFILVGWDRSFRLLLGPPGSTDYLLLLQIFSGVV